MASGRQRLPESQTILVDGAVVVSTAKGPSFVVDLCDREQVEGHRWTLSPGGYVRRAGGSSGRWIFLHQVLCPAADGLRVDHIDRDKLNNRRANLRPASPSLNGHNADYSFRSPTSFRGVCRERTKWGAKISHGGRQRRLGVFSTPEDAARAYDSAASQLYGPNAILNYPRAS